MWLADTIEVLPEYSITIWLLGCMQEGLGMLSEDDK